MPLPRSHLESLQRHLHLHEERLAILHRQLDNLEAPRDPNPKVRSPEWVMGQREVLEREIRIHKQLIDLGRDPKVLDALGDLAENRDYAREAARDPQDAARKYGIDLPANMTLRLELEPNRVHLRIIFYEDLFPFMVIWSSDSGFSPLAAPSLSRKGTSGASAV